VETTEHEVASLLFRSVRSIVGVPPWSDKQGCVLDQYDKTGAGVPKLLTLASLARRIEEMADFPWRDEQAASLLFQQDRSFSGKPWDPYCCIPGDGADGQPLDKMGSLITKVEDLGSLPWTRAPTARPTTYIELCTGSFAVGLRLLGGPNAKPPVSYMGSKVGYGAAVLAALGLKPGQGADRVVMVEPGPWARIWTVLTEPTGCERVAEILRSWIPCPSLADEEGHEPGDGKGDEEVCEWCDGTDRWQTKSLFDHLRTKEYLSESRDHRQQELALARKNPCVVEASAFDVEPKDVCDDPEGCVVYIDPPYVDTTGYLNEFPRDQVVDVARRWADFGALVAISEAVKIDIPGWHHVDVAHTRRGTKRSFGDTEEWLTMNRQPTRVAPKKMTWF